MLWHMTNRTVSTLRVESFLLRILAPKLRLTIEFTVSTMARWRYASVALEHIAPTNTAAFLRKKPRFLLLLDGMARTGIASSAPSS